MKKILFYAMCVAALATAACSDDDNGPKVRIETISFEACEFAEGKSDNAGANNVPTAYEEFGATFAHKNYYTMISGVVVGMTITAFTP